MKGPSQSQQPPEKFLSGLVELERAVQKDVQEAASFRKANQSFDARDDTTQLLLAACEKLWNEKLAMEKARFEEHSSSLHLLCQHLRTTVDEGLSESVYKEKLAADSHGKLVPRKPAASSIFAFCCQAEFPEQQAFWHDITRKLVAQYTVLRSGSLARSAAHDLVPGDVVHLAAGEKCPLDGRVLLCTDSAMVDSSHVTGRANDLRVLARKPTASSPIESRNVVLRDTYVVTGSLFMMVVRSLRNAFISPSSYGGNETFHPTLNMQVPEGIAMSTCQSVFKSLCVKAHLFCKAFKVMQKLSEVGVIVVCLTQELVAACDLKKVNAAFHKLNKALLFVNCDCESQSLSQLCSDLSLERVDFDEMSNGEGCSSTGTHQSDICEYVGGSISMQRMSDADHSKADTVITKLLNSPASVIVGNISQVVLLHVCRSLAKPHRPLLFVANGFFFTQCLINLTREEPQLVKHMNSIAAMNSARMSPTGTQGLEFSSDHDHSKLAPPLQLIGASSAGWDDKEDRKGTTSSIPERQASYVTTSTMTSPEPHSTGFRAPRTSRSSRGHSNVVHFQVDPSQQHDNVINVDGANVIRPEDSIASLPTVATSTGSPTRGATSPYHRWNQQKSGSYLEIGSMLQSGSLSVGSSEDGHGPDPVSLHGSMRQQGERSIILLSANALGVLSEEADCIMTKSDLSHLAQACEILQRKLPRRQHTVS